jgi:hypothetical protein
LLRALSATRIRQSFTAERRVRQRPAPHLDRATP